MAVGERGRLLAAGADVRRMAARFGGEGARGWAEKLGADASGRKSKSG